MAAYKILSLDGGGTWALIQVRILQQRYGEKALGHNVLREYDLIIANSGGSMVLSAMCMNHSLDKIANMFLDETILQTIFVKRWFYYYAPFFKRFLPRFKATKKMDGLRKQLVNEKEGLNGDILLSKLPEKIGKKDLQLIITCFDYDKERAVYFRSNPKSNMETCNIQEQMGVPVTDTFKTVSLLHAVHGSSNAPVQFFNDPAIFSFDSEKGSCERRYWDGAVGGNNNPVDVGILEAIANGAKKEDIKVVCIGTSGTVCPVLYDIDSDPRYEYDWLIKYSETGGWIQDLTKMTTSILSDPPDAATFIAHHLLEMKYTAEPSDKLIRINPLIKPILDEEKNAWMAPGENWDACDLEKLFVMDMAVSDSYGVGLIDKLCTDYFNDKFDNQGIRMGGNKVEAILGHKKFSAALQAWKNW